MKKRAQWPPGSLSLGRLRPLSLSSFSMRKAGRKMKSRKDWRVLGRLIKPFLSGSWSAAYHRSLSLGNICSFLNCATFCWNYYGLLLNVCFIFFPEFIHISDWADHRPRKISSDSYHDFLWKCFFGILCRRLLCSRITNVRAHFG